MRDTFVHRLGCRGFYQVIRFSCRTSGDARVSNIFFARTAVAGAVALMMATACAPTGQATGRSTLQTAPALATSAPPSSVPTVPTATTNTTPTPGGRETVMVGAARLADDGFATLNDQRVGVVTNDAVQVGGRSLLDLLVEADNVDLVAIFAPEHGLAALDPAGTAVGVGTDPARDVVVHSLYGAQRAPTPEALADLDVLVFDLQDVGVRAYTYLSTMGLAMVAAAEADLRFVVLDRPNPLGGERLGGYVREPSVDSFIAQYPIPSVHGLTAGELALAIKGERWLVGLDDLELEIVAMEGWDRGDRWSQTGLTWSPPSPSLPTVESVALYPGTVLFEATSLSVGRGTDEPFTVVGGPWVDADGVAQLLNDRGLAGVRFEATTFTPVASPSVPDPPLVDQVVPGVRIVVENGEQILPVEVGVHLLEVFWRQAEDRGIDDFLAEPDLLDLLAGTSRLRRELQQGIGASAIIDAWSDDLAGFDELRLPYLLYD